MSRIERVDLYDMSNKGGRPRNIDHAAVLKTFEKEDNYKKTAEIHDISISAVRKILDKHGLLKPREPYTDVVRRRANEIIDYIMANGGTIPQVIRDLGVKISHVIVCEEVQKRGLRLLDYKHMSKEVGCWKVTKPGFKRHGSPQGEYYVPVTCKDCGHEHLIRERIISSNNHSAPACPNCGSGTNEDKRLPHNRCRRRIDYEKVSKLYKQMGSKAAVAKLLGISVSSVYRHLVESGDHIVKPKN